jgi:parvulin-like peptidyl-prolyl isomerase
MRSGVSKDKNVVARIDEMKNKILRDAYINSEVAKAVTDQKVSEKYAEISTNLAGKKEYLISHIVTKTKDEALKISKEITAKKKAISFVDAAKKYSLDAESAERGGDLGFVLEDNMIKEISDAVVGLKSNEISQPIQTKFGWHLVKFSEVREAQPLSFEAVKQNIREQLEQDATNEIESKIVKDAKVEILIKNQEEPSKKEELKPAAVDVDSAQPAEEIVEPAQNAVVVDQKSEEEIQLEQQNEKNAEQQQEKSDKNHDEKSKEAKHQNKKHRK